MAKNCTQALVQSIIQIKKRKHIVHSAYYLVLLHCFTLIQGHLFLAKRLPHMCFDSKFLVSLTYVLILFQLITGYCQPVNQVNYFLFPQL